MNFYKLIKLNQIVKNPNIKLLGIYILYTLRQRHLSIRIDPSLNCNLFCKMCYFSSPEYRRNHKGLIPQSDFNHIARILFKKAFQVYIGCGAEPTTHRNFMDLIELANQYKVPNIGVVTNAQLLTRKNLEQMAELQLQELTLSCHGVNKENYEFFMKNSRYDRFIETLEWINDIKKQRKSSYPEIRINYTVNNKNLSELKCFFETFDKYNIRTLQVRPVANIGGEYSESISNEQIEEYNNIIKQLTKECYDRDIRLLANTHDVKFEKKNINRKVADAVYCYIGPQTKDTFDFEWSTASFGEFVKKTKWKKKFFHLLFRQQKDVFNESVANYNILN